MNSDPIIPAQHEGAKSDTEYSVECATEKEAVKVFEHSAGRLLDVNEWRHFSGALSADFQVTDKQGKEVRRKVGLGDYFRINIPGPGTSAGQGYDWVKVESIDNLRDPSGTTEEISFRVRPTSSPLSNDESTAHFFDNQATSTFQVTRNGTVVQASVHGRNETPNLDTEKPKDAARNALVASGAISGLSKIQWKNLVSGIMKGR